MAYRIVKQDDSVTFNEGNLLKLITELFVDNNCSYEWNTRVLSSHPWGHVTSHNETCYGDMHGELLQ
jgi:hypothetical protein